MLNGTHHWFSVLAVMGGVAVLLKARTPPRIAIAGAALGVAAFFTQTRGPLAALGVGGYLVWDRLQTKQPWSLCLKNELLLLVSLAATWGALSSYFLAKVGFWQLGYFQVIYLLRYVSSGPSGLSVGPLDIRAGLMTPEGRLFLLVYCAGAHRLRHVLVQMRARLEESLARRAAGHRASDICRRGDVRGGSPESELNQALLRRDARHHPVRATAALSVREVPCAASLQLRCGSGWFVLPPIKAYPGTGSRL